MCVVKRIQKGDEVAFICTTTGLPIVEHLEFGAFCEKHCGFDAALFGRMQSERFVSEMGPIFKSNFEDE